ncbi:MAG: hypothetical protein ACC631_09830, partial [Halocynthiibacter sp.]
MDDSKFGKVDQRGYWRPQQLIEYPKVFVWPLQIVGFLKWLPRYIFPWNISYTLLAIMVWMFLTPSVERMKSFS